MIRINIPGFFATDSGGPRWGDAQIMDDGTNYVVIDGYTSVGKTRLVKRLKAIGCKSPYLYISHAHGDHDDGINAIISDTWFTPKLLGCYDPDSLSGGFSNSEIKSDADYLRSIINKAKKRGIPVKLLKHGDHQVHGEIDFYVYRKQPSYQGASTDPHGWAYINDGSLCFWFPSLAYWTSGDGPENIYDLCKSVGAKPKWFKIPHHGNNCPRSQAQGMKSLGALYCWDNDYSTSITDFLQYGRARCIEAGIKYLNCHGDINAIFYRGRAVIYKDSNIYRYVCSYNGAPTLTTPVDLAVVKAVLKGTYGNGNTRITGLLDKRYNAGLVQTEINNLIALLK